MKKSCLEKPKILLINFDCSCIKLKELQETIGIEITETEIISIVLDILRLKSAASLMLDVLKKDMFEHLMLEDNFLTEIDLIYKEYTKITFKMLEQLESFNCYNGDTLPYNFASLLGEDTVVMHIVKPEDL